MEKRLELGIYSLGDNLMNPTTQQTYSAKERINQIQEIASLSEQAGFDIFHLGESHQKQFVSQAHLIILTAIAQATSSIRLGSAATIISSSDPVRIYEDAATLDIISDGRMELVLGRSARPSNYDLLGFDLRDYEALYEERLSLLKLINQREVVKWHGQFRKELDNVSIEPRALQKDGIPLWRASSGSLNSVKKAAEKGDPIYLVHPKGQLNTLQELVDAYRLVWEREGYDNQASKIGVAGYLYLDKDGAKARKDYYPYVKQGTEILFDYHLEEEWVNQAHRPSSFINVGEPNEIAEKILYQHERLGMDRYIGQVDFAGMEMSAIMRTIDMMGEFVIPQIKKALQ